MHLRKQKKPNGRIYLSIVQSYRTPEGKSRSKTLWSLGYLDDLTLIHPDPLAHFQEVVDEMNRMREEDPNAPVSLSFSPQAKIPFGAGKRIEAGAAVVLRMLHRNLRIDQVLEDNAPGSSANRSLSRLIELLVWNRIAHPQIIIDAWDMRRCIPGMDALSRPDLFRGVELLGRAAPQLRQRFAVQLEKRHHATKSSWVFCFVANYYIEETSWTQPAFRKRWEQRQSPLVQLAVMTDRNGMPIDYSIYHGSLASPLSPFPAVQELGTRYPDVRLVIVTNKAVGSSTDDMALLLDYNCGFVMLQSMRKGQRTSREWVLDSQDYQPFGTQGSRFKERLSIRQVAAPRNRKQQSSMAIKEVAFWWREAFERSRFDRFRIVKRNEDVFTHGMPSDGTVRPVRAVRGFGDAKPGEVGEHVWDVYWDKIAADEAMDGYCDIITSELDLPATQVVDLYQNFFMWRDMFKPAWGEWSNCPGRVSRESYIQAHFLVCFLAASVSQLLYCEAGARFPDESGGSTLACMVGREVSPGQFFFDFRSHLSDALAEEASVNLSRPLVSATELERMMRNARQEL